MHARVLPLGVLLGSLALLPACGGDDKPGPVAPSATGISGTVTVQPGSPADPTNARAAVYSSLADFNNDAWVRQTAVQRNGTSWNFSLELNLGSYYVDVWKDVNNNGVIDGGDIYGYYTTGQGGAPAPVMLTQGQMGPISLEVRLTPAAVKRLR